MMLFLFLTGCFNARWEGFLPQDGGEGEPLLGDLLLALDDGTQLRVQRDRRVSDVSLEVTDALTVSGQETVGPTWRVRASSEDPDNRFFLYVPIPELPGRDTADTGGAPRGPGLQDHRLWAQPSDGGDALRIDMAESGLWFVQDQAYRWGWMDGGFDHDVTLVLQPGERGTTLHDVGPGGDSFAPGNLRFTFPPDAVTERTTIRATRYPAWGWPDAQTDVVRLEADGLELAQALTALGYATGPSVVQYSEDGRSFAPLPSTYARGEVSASSDALGWFYVGDAPVVRSGTRLQAEDLCVTAYTGPSGATAALFDCDPATMQTQVNDVGGADPIQQVNVRSFGGSTVALESSTGASCWYVSLTLGLYADRCGQDLSSNRTASSVFEATEAADGVLTLRAVDRCVGWTTPAEPGRRVRLVPCEDAAVATSVQYASDE